MSRRGMSRRGMSRRGMSRRGMSRRGKAALAAGAAATGALAVAGPLLDRFAARLEARMNPLLPGPVTPVSDRARALHATLRVADLHADSLLFGRDLLRRADYGHVDVPRMIEGRVALQVFSMAVKTPTGINIERNDDSTDEVRKLALAKRWPPSTWRRLLPRVAYLAGNAHRFAAGSGGTFRIIETRDDLFGYLADHMADQAITAGLLSIEGAHALDGDPANVDVVADLGIRMISPAHFFDTAFGGSAHGMEQGGLTARGREMIRRMEARGVVLDVAHSSARTIDDALEVSTRPVVASHTGVRGVLDNARNLSDAHLDGIAATGGLVGIGFWPTASGGDDAAAIARSIAYAVERVGAEHVALGSDWDGAVAVPFDAAHVIRLTDALLEVGLDEAAIRAVMGENVLRVLAAALPGS
jgi:membrane dipeptidase